MRTGVKFTCVKQRGYDQLMHMSEIIPNIRDTKTLTWHECWTNIVFVIQIYQAAMVDRNHFPDSVISKRLNTSISYSARKFKTYNMQDLKAFVTVQQKTKLSFLRFCGRPVVTQSPAVVYINAKFAINSLYSYKKTLAIKSLCIFHKPRI